MIPGKIFQFYDPSVLSIKLAAKAYINVITTDAIIIVPPIIKDNGIAFIIGVDRVFGDIMPNM